MTLTNSFIAELVRDANRLDHLDASQKRRMLERAITTIRDMRETVGIPSGPGRDSVVNIHTVALSIERGWRSDEDVRNAPAAGSRHDPGSAYHPRHNPKSASPNLPADARCVLPTVNGTSYRQHSARKS
ncbi:hypothetical protein [Rhizobium nepotum]|uniref:hypothetical protein n=1 Tax=Rhizobium nepotum TaxID=1035271 RepID=UPI003CF795F3